MIEVLRQSEKVRNAVSLLQGEALGTIAKRTLSH